MKTKKLPVVNIVTLGCSKNVVDSEVLLGQLKKNKVIAEHESQANYNIVVVNTCGFINDAKQESIDTILRYANEKQEGKIEKLYVMGCLSERYKEDLKKEIPEVDAFFGVKEFSDILRKFNVDYRKELIGDRAIATPKHYAFLKIAEGCNQKCSFCAIPLIRGKYESRSAESLVSEAKSLADKGVKELVLIAQDLTYYGYDLAKKRNLSDLLKKLCQINGIEWIRLQYAYPSAFPMDVLDVMASESKICKYLDIPFQHINSDILKSMKRGIDKEKTYRLIDKIRTKIPDIALRSSFIVGYPGETKAQFEELISFVKDVKFDRLGVFTYSHEENTLAHKLKDNVSAKTKLKRMEELMAVQQEISSALNYQKIGRTYKVLIDGMENETYIGRTEFDSPEVDNEVLIKNSGKLKIGSFYDVKITQAFEYDLEGCVVK